ncbi:MAG: glycosyltransferase family 39 protein [Alphaproteobacteria bacterium]|nr:glycosyltransferase family 39 protein [Alphaproteobacteria bacterium]
MRVAKWRGGIPAVLLLCLLCLGLYAPGLNSVPPLDRDEARFAQATRQMLETDDFLHIRFQDEARNKKPAAIYWLQAAAVAAFSTPAATTIWPYRLPSVLGAGAAVVLTFALGRALFDAEAGPNPPRRSALLGAVLLASALGLAVEAHIAKTDAALLAAVVAGQGVLGIAYVRARSGRNLPVVLAGAFWMAEAAGVLLKGPIAPALAITTAAVLATADRDARWLRQLRPVAGMLLAALIVAPWVIAMQHATGDRFLADSLGQDLMAKLIGAQESHGAPPFYYLLLSVASFWPGSLLLVPGLARGWRHHDRPAQRFLLAWVLPAWVFLELVPTKLPHYILPLYPALALLVGSALADGLTRERERGLGLLDMFVRGLWGAVTLLLAAALVYLPIRFGDYVPASAVAGGMLLIAAGGTLLAGWPGPRAAAALMAVQSAVFIVIAATAVLPQLNRLWLSRSASVLVMQHPPRPGQPIVAVGYSEPSLVFLLGGNVQLATAPSAAEALERGGEALVSGREDAMFRQAISARGLAARVLDRVPGLDYSNGQRMVLTLYDVEPN